jgi:hypothetical protein
MVENSNGIFSQKELWLDVRNNSQRFAPHPSFIVGTLLLSCVTYRLARDARTNHIDEPFTGAARRKRSHVSPPRNARPVFRQYAAGVIVDLHLPLAGHAGTFEAEIKAADPCEERAEGHGHPFHARNVARASSESTPVSSQD